MAKAKEAPAAAEIEAVDEKKAIAPVEEAPAVDPNAYLRELVPFYAFKDNGKYKDDITVGVNGRIVRIKRGVQVMIPRYIRNVILRGMDQDTRTADLMDAQERAYNDKVQGGYM